MKDSMNKPVQPPQNWSADAQALMKKIWETDIDQSISLKTTCMKTNDIIDIASEAVKKEISFIKKEDCSKNMFEEYIQRQKN
jgi:hypothetical protein